MCGDSAVDDTISTVAQDLDELEVAVVDDGAQCGR